MFSCAVRGRSMIAAAFTRVCVQVHLIDRICARARLPAIHRVYIHIYIFIYIATTGHFVQFCLVRCCCCVKCANNNSEPPIAFIDAAAVDAYQNNCAWYAPPRRRRMRMHEPHQSVGIKFQEPFFYTQLFVLS